MGPLGPGEFGNRARHFGILLGIADHGKGHRLAASGRGLKGRRIRLENLTILSFGDNTIKILSVSLEALDPGSLDRSVAGSRLAVAALIVFAPLDAALGLCGRLPDDGHASFRAILQERTDDEVESPGDRLGDIFHQVLLMGEFAFDPLGLGGEVVKRNLAELPAKRVELISVVVGSEYQRSGLGIKHLARLLGRLAIKSAIDEKLHLLAIVNANDVIELAWLEFGFAIQVGHLPVAVIRAFRGEAESEHVLVVAQDPARFGIAVILNDPGKTAPLLGLVDHDPGRDRKVLGWQKALDGPVVGREQALHLTAMKIG